MLVLPCLFIPCFTDLNEQFLSHLVSFFLPFACFLQLFFASQWRALDFSTYQVSQSHDVRHVPACLEVHETISEAVAKIGTMGFGLVSRGGVIHLIDSKRLVLPCFLEHCFQIQTSCSDYSNDWLFHWCHECFHVVSCCLMIVSWLFPCWFHVSFHLASSYFQVGCMNVSMIASSLFNNKQLGGAFCFKAMISSASSTPKLPWVVLSWVRHARENLCRTWRIFTWLGGLGVRESFSKCSKQFRFRNYRRICPDKSHPKKGNVSILTSVSFTWVAQPPPRWLNDQWTTTCCEFLKYQHFTRRLNDEHIFLWLKRF